MRYRVIAIGLLAWACASSEPSSPAPLAQQVSFRDLLGLQRPTTVELSPDGAHVAFVTVTADLAVDAMRTTLWLLDTAGGEPRRVAASDSVVGAIAWSGQGDRLAFVATSDAGSSIRIVDPAGAPVQTLAPGVAILDLTWSPDGSRIAFTAPASNPELPQLWTIALATGATQQLVDDRAALTEPRWSPDGRFIAYVRFPADVPDGRFFPTIELIEVASGSTRRLAGPGEFVSSPRWSPDSTRVAYLAHPAGTEAERALAFDRLQLLSLAGGTPQRLAANVPQVVRRPMWSGDGKTLYFEAFPDETGQLYSVPAGGGDAVAFTSESGVAHLASYSRDGSSVAFVLESPQAPPEVHVSPVTPFSPHRLTDLNRALREKPASDSRVVRWTSSDGLAVSGVLLLPHGYVAGTPLPTLVVSHGGPATLVVLSYPDSWLLSAAPAWTADGWAVFYPNYRGSTNADEAFAMAEIGQVGRGDFADVMTGVDALVAENVADPNRLAHAGWSFGGFLSGWANTQTDRFKALVAGAGPYGWVTTYEDGTDQFALRTYLLGTPTSNPQGYRDASVSTFVDRARTPTLLFGAEDDDLVPAAQPQAFFAALQARGVPSELHVYPDEPHELQRPSNQLDKLQRERAWVRRFVPAR